MKNIIVQDNRQTIIESVAKHTGKMAGIPSISTSCLESTFCQKMQKCSGAICGKCYAKKYLSMRKTLKEKCSRNQEFYTTTILNSGDIPKFNANMFRFESFGEITNEIQLHNYCTIAWNNEHCTFTLWSKNIDLIHKYFTDHCKPENLNIIASSRFINKSDLDYIIEKYGDPVFSGEIFDGIFTVYTKEHAKNHNININCGSKKCIDCGLCYSKDFNKYCEIHEINEILK